MAKTRETAKKHGASSGRPRGISDALYKELGSIGKQRYPLEPAGLVGRTHVLNTPAVRARAGANATPDRLAPCAAEALRDIVANMRDHTNRFIAEAALATLSKYEDKLIYERQELLQKEHGISINVYAERRREVISTIIFELKSEKAYESEAAEPDILQVSEPILRPPPVESVAREATWLYCSLVASYLVNDELLRLGGSPERYNTPNVCLYERHVRFLLKAHHYLYVMSVFDDKSIKHLNAQLKQIVSYGPLQDMIYMAYVYSDNEQLIASGARDSALVLIRKLWDTWYGTARGQTSSESVLGAMASTVLSFRHTLPGVDVLNLKDMDSNEVRFGISYAETVFRQVLAHRDVIQNRKRNILRNYTAQARWLKNMNQRLQAVIHEGL